MTAAPEHGTQDPAERVARAHHAANYQAEYGWPAWDDSPSPYRMDMLRASGLWLDAIRAAGLVVVALPEPGRWVDCLADDGSDVLAPQWDAADGDRLTAFPDGVETDDRCLVEDLDELRGPALATLAAIVACEQYRAERQGGEPQ